MTHYYLRQYSYLFPVRNKARAHGRLNLNLNEYMIELSISVSEVKEATIAWIKDSIPNYPNINVNVSLI